MQHRLRKEAKDFTKKYNKDSNIYAEPVSEDFLHWIGKINGPEESPYANGIFVVELLIPNQYPFAPPKVSSNTKIWHPNISSRYGTISLGILNDHWATAYTIRTVLLSIMHLLSSPEMDQEVAILDNYDSILQYKTNRKEFNRKAKQWTIKYASPDKLFSNFKNYPLVLEEFMQLQSKGESTMSKREAKLILCEWSWNLDDYYQTLTIGYLRELEDQYSIVVVMDIKMLAAMYVGFECIKNY